MQQTLLTALIRDVFLAIESAEQPQVHSTLSHACLRKHQPKATIGTTMSKADTRTDTAGSNM
jgi:hypothetical protein